MKEKKTEEFKEENGKFYMKRNREMLLLLMLARMMKLDLKVLLYLWEKYREDVFFWFFMFAGMNVKFLTFEQLLRMIKTVDKWLDEGKVDDTRAGKCLNDIVEGVDKEGEWFVISALDREWFLFGKEGLIVGSDEDVVF